MHDVTARDGAASIAGARFLLVPYLAYHLNLKNPLRSLEGNSLLAMNEDCVDENRYCCIKALMA
jgi:hypothetical protein